MPDTAWSDPRTRDAFRRARRVGWLWLVGAIILIVALGAYISILYSHADAIIANGIRVPGVVREDPPQGIQCINVPVDIAFDVDGREEVHAYYVDGCGGDGLTKGTRVTVVYDRANPADFVVNGEPNEEPLPALLGVVAFAAAIFLGGGSGVRAVRLRRLRRALQETPWTDTTARIATFNSVWTQGGSVVELPDEVRGTDLFGTLSRRTHGAVTDGSGRQLRVAGRGTTRVLQAPDGFLVGVKRLRAESTRARARRALENLDATDTPE